MDFPQSQQEWETLLNGRFDREPIIAHLKEHQETRKHFLEITLLRNEYAWRAAWLLKGAVSKQDNYDDFIDRAIKLLPDLPDGHQREILKLLENMSVNESMEGPLFDVCMSIWESPGKIPSTRMTAFLFILETVKKYPELKTELDHLTQDHYMESLSPGVKRVLEKRIQKLK
ncbi:MAG: hypothetical protein R8G66_13415 [Cytophagales bacterium]|nr:hypothetical protein [Cytophagales bacterium]